MKIRTLLSAPVVVVVAMALASSALAQTSSTLHLTTALSGAAASDGSGSADFIVARATVGPPPTAKTKVVTKFSVVVESVSLADNSILDVFVGPAVSANEPFGKFVGRIQLLHGSGALLQVGAKAPAISQGSTVVVVEHPGTTADRIVLQGKF